MLGTQEAAGQVAPLGNTEFGHQTAPLPGAHARPAIPPVCASNPAGPAPLRGPPLLHVTPPLHRAPPLPRMARPLPHTAPPLLHRARGLASGRWIRTRLTKGESPVSPAPQSAAIQGRVRGQALLSCVWKLLRCPSRCGAPDRGTGPELLGTGTWQGAHLSEGGAQPEFYPRTPSSPKFHSQVYAQKKLRQTPTRPCRPRSQQHDPQRPRDGARPSAHVRRNRVWPTRTVMVILCVILAGPSDHMCVSLAETDTCIGGRSKAGGPPCGRASTVSRRPNRPKSLSARQLPLADRLSWM